MRYRLFTLIAALCVVAATSLCVIWARSSERGATPFPVEYNESLQLGQVLVGLPISLDKESIDRNLTNQPVIEINTDALRKANIDPNPSLEVQPSGRRLGEALADLLGGIDPRLGFDFRGHVLRISTKDDLRSTPNGWPVGLGRPGKAQTLLNNTVRSIYADATSGNMLVGVASQTIQGEATIGSLLHLLSRDVDVDADWDALLLEGIGPDTRFTLNGNSVTYAQLLAEAFRTAKPSAKVVFEPRGDQLVITTAAKIDARKGAIDRGQRLWKFEPIALGLAGLLAVGFVLSQRFSRVLAYAAALLLCGAITADFMRGGTSRAVVIGAQRVAVASFHGSLNSFMMPDDPSAVYQDPSLRPRIAASTVQTPDGAPLQQLGGYRWTSTGLPYNMTTALVPIWWLLVPLLVPPVAWGFAYRRRSTRFHTGCCKVCGYDLRGSLERCPECGAPIDQRESEQVHPA